MQLHPGGDFYLAQPDPALKHIVQLDVLEEYGLWVLCNQGWASLFFHELVPLHQTLEVAIETGFGGLNRGDGGHGGRGRVRFWWLGLQASCQRSHELSVATGSISVLSAPATVYLSTGRVSSVMEESHFLFKLL